MADAKSADILLQKLKDWENGVLAEKLAMAKETQTEFRSGSGEFVTQRIYTPLNISSTDYLKEIGFPGQYPFTRGNDALAYRSFKAGLGFYAGYGSGETANRRFRKLYQSGARDIGLALDLPTQLGLNSDDSMAEGEVGKTGLALDTFADLTRAFKGIPLNNLRTGTVGNCIGPWALALFIILCEDADLSSSQITVRIQNDPIKEFTGRGTYIFNPAVSIDLASDVVEYMVKNLPNWEPQWSCTTTMRWGGCTAAQEVGFGIADLLAYTDAARSKGVKPEDYIPRVDLHMSSDNDLFEEVAKFRAVRRLWAKIASHKYKTKDPRILRLRISTYTAANRLTAQEPMNNIVRSTMHVLASMLAGVDHISNAAYDEALALPTFESTRLAGLTKIILHDECCIGNTVDPLGGSYYIESLTNEMEEKGMYWFKQVENAGGAIAAVDTGLYLKEMASGQYHNQQEIENNRRPVIGVNKFVLNNKIKVPLFKGDTKGEARQIERLNKIRKTRDGNRVRQSLDKLRKTAEIKAAGHKQNIVPPILDAVRVYATEGEIFDILRNTFGEYHPLTIF